MGKKSKVGKQRRDKYYKLAKESGFRSRAAFKLIQLNRKFEFLQRCQVLVDLCAAPGGWLQVASQAMPVSSLIIGVDLFPIKSIPGVLTFQDDITKDSCLKTIQRELKTWSVDCVLHDGAPNVGQNWVHDAFMQAQLTLSALKLACKILRKGGWFVTKIFRSKDYLALINVFGQLFKKVNATKPQASRLESAEIFVVCEGFKGTKFDPKILDFRAVFKEENLEPEKPVLSLVGPEKTKKRKAEGYADGDHTLFHTLNVMDFLTNSNFIQLLADANQILLNDDRIASHPETTEEIKKCCEDIKVLGRKELRLLLSWRKKLKVWLKTLEPALEPSAKHQKTDEEIAVEEEEEIQRRVEEATSEEMREKKRRRKKDQKSKRQLKERLDLKMVLPGDTFSFVDDQELFALSKIRNAKQLDRITSGITSSTKEDDEEKTNSSDSESDQGDGATYDPQSCPSTSDQSNPLLLDLDVTSAEEKRSKVVDEWFGQTSFEDLVCEDDEDADIQAAIDAFDKAKTPQSTTSEAKDNDRAELENERKKGLVSEELLEEEDVAVSNKAIPEQIPRLDPEGLAVAELMKNSNKAKRDLIEWGYNRYSHNDHDLLPEWFVDDEKKHSRKQLPITKEQVDYYQSKLKEVNARPVKKVLEAKARKKKKAIRKLDKARKRADNVLDREELTEAEKRHEVKRIYKIAGVDNKKPKVSYVVAKKGMAGKRVRRPQGVSGRFKVVDPRMKKDNRKRNMNAKAKRGGKRSRR